MSENKNNDDMLELDLSNDSEDTLQINFDDLNTDVEISFDDLQDSIDVPPVDDNQPIENIELMSEHAPHNEPESTLDSTPSKADVEPEITLDSNPSEAEAEPEPEPELSLDSTPSETEAEPELSLGDIPSLDETKTSEPELTLENDSSIEEPKVDNSVDMSLEEPKADDSMNMSLEEPKTDDIPLSNDIKEDTTPVASTDPNSDPLGMDWQEPFGETVKAESQDKASSDAPKEDLAINISDKPKKKKVKKVPIIIGSIVAVLALLVGIGYYLSMVNPVTSNAIMASILKPNKYYQMVESKNINVFMNKSFKNIDNNMALLNDQANAAAATNTTITLSEGLTSLASSLGPYGSILQSIKSVTLKTDSIAQDSSGSYILQLGLNDKTIVDVNIVMDNKNNAIYVQCPTVLKRWIKISVPEGTNIDFSKGKKLESKDIQTIMQKYIPILISNFDNVKLKKGKNITIDKTKVDVSEIEIEITKENQEKILKLFVDELKNDDLIYSYLESYGIFKSKTEYTKAVNSLTNSSSKKQTDDKVLSEEEKTEQEKKAKGANLPITMIVYVDKSGTIVGRDIKQSSTLLGYKYYDSGKVSKLAFDYKTDDTSINALGNITDSNKTYSGSTVITVTEKDNSKKETAKEKSSSDTLDSDQPFTITLDYKDIKLVNEKKGLFKGNFTITPSDIKNMKGVSVNLNYSVQNNKQASEIVFNMLNQPAISIATTQDTSQQKNVTIPSQFIDQTKLSKDYLTQYNTLLELDTYTPVVTLMNSLNNATVKQLVAAFYVRPGYNRLNGKQTAKDLVYIAKLNKNTDLYELAMYGYKMTAAGKNPGLDGK